MTPSPPSVLESGTCEDALLLLWLGAGLRPRNDSCDRRRAERSVTWGVWVVVVVVVVVGFCVTFL